jgi:holo-[acyl-carrier protein] synthase
VTVVGVGTDLVDLDRFREVLARTPSIVDRLFTPDEQAYAHRRRDPTEPFAARFAAKEAVLKALGLGLGSVAFREIEVVRAESGRPSIVLHGAAADAARDRGVGGWLVTLSHTAHLAQAIAMAMAPSRHGPAA